MREFNAKMISPILRWTGFRFDKTFRQADKGVKAIIFKYVINTTKANLIADGF